MEIFELIPAVLPLIQYPAALLTCSAYYFIGDTRPSIRKIGFTVGVIANISWIIYSISPVQWGLVGTNLFILGFGVRGYLNNSNKKEKKE
jgi:hypothetical protein